MKRSTKFNQEERNLIMKRSTKFTWVLCAAGLMLGSSVVTQAAGTPGISFLTSNYEDGGGYAVGYDFTPSTTLSVTDLGYYDNGNDGLAVNHNVGIYVVSNQTLVASALVLTNDTLHINQYWYHDITAVTLNAGVTYRAVAVTTSGEGWAYNPFDGANPTPTPNPSLTLGNTGYFVGSNGNLIYPEGTNGKWFAVANFLVASPVPEPSAAALLGLGGLLLIRRKR
jgi:hypothetical protein